jgi:DNA-binding NarL/FixJ family response regulator
MPLHVVVLSHKSLFADGIVSQLRARGGQFEIDTVDAGAPDALERVRAVKPQIILLDVNDADVLRHCPVTEILRAAPEIKVMQLDANSDDIYVYMAARQRARGIAELVEVMQTVTA